MKEKATSEDKYMRFLQKWITQERPNFKGEPIIIDRDDVIHVLLCNPGFPIKTEYIYFNTWYDCPEIFKLDYAD